MKIFFATQLNNKHPYLKSKIKWLEYYGHEVEPFECLDLKKYRDPVLPADVKMNQIFVKKCLDYKPDVLLVFKGNTIFKESLETIKKKIRPLMVTWWVDDPFADWDDALNIKPYKNSLESLLLWDYFFIYDSYFINRLKRFGVNNPFFLPNATDDEYFYKMDEFLKDDIAFYGSDISFLGRPSRRRAQMIKSLTGYNIKLWGGLGNWFDPFYKNLNKKEYVEIEEIRKIHNLSKINLNNHLIIAANGANVRTFDIPVCGGFILTDECSDITTHLFEEGTEVITYSDFKDMKDKVNYYLSNEKERLEIANNGKLKVLKKHLYKHRIKELLDIINV